jgi:AcrR family transcriptional regulator
VVERGRASLTIRALAERASTSNGSIYHAFGSLETVVATAWLRRSHDFLTMQKADVVAELAHGHARAAVQSAADAPARFAERDLLGAQLLTRLDRADVMTDAVDPPVADQLSALDSELLDTLRLLAAEALGRRDGAAVDVITSCVVRLPGALLFPGIRRGAVDPLARRQLAAAVTAVLDCGLTDRPTPAGTLETT